MTAKLILMRHGESVWNQLNLFTGWVDIPLSEKGIAESIEGGKKIQKISIDLVFTSTLMRAQMTAVLALLHHTSGKIPVFQHPGEGKLEEWGTIYSDAAKAKTIPVYTACELNERMYGKLQGLNKKETAMQFGDEQVHTWRRSYDGKPPEGESLQMTIARSLPYFQNKIVPHLEQGKNVLIAAHGNSLRGIVMHLDGLSKEEVAKLEIATGVPLVYEFGLGKWKKVS
ncbi:MAG: 2,3-bisphosphoglycerate-dependent phosphoglycerate mutase [Chlamydiae bacterium]|nr:2,3-bisphosphoglycerate-dependent phosphoglycerate mutase [Chlamydiota bacterium]